MKSNQEQLDRYFEDICRYDLFTDIINAQEEVKTKYTFYSADEYHQYQRQLFLSDLRQLVSKNASKQLKNLPQFQSSLQQQQHQQQNDQYKHDIYLSQHCQMVKKFVVIDFNSASKGQKNFQGTVFNQNDYVLVYKADSQNIEKDHFLGVVDSAREGLIILKTIINMEEPDERVFNIGKSLNKDSDWVVLRMCNLVNFNKNYLSLQAFQDLIIQEQILDPNIQSKQDTFSLSKQQITELKKDMPFDYSQLQALQKAMKKEGITIINGGYASGKTLLTLSIIKAFLMVSRQFKEQIEQSKQQKKVKRYSIKELLENDSSDEEGYKNYNSQTHFPWFKAGFQHINDELDFTEQEKTTNFKKEQYPTSEMTDHKIILQPKVEDFTMPPERIMVLAPNAACIDQLLDLAQKMNLPALGGKILRIGRSTTREDLNNLYSVEYLSGANQPKGPRDMTNYDQIKQDLLKQASLVFAVPFSLTTYMIEKTLQKFDTVIVDDASVVHEIDIVQGLKKQGIRLVMLGNNLILQDMFHLNPKANKSLFFRHMHCLSEKPQAYCQLQKSFRPLQFLIPSQVSPVQQKKSAKKDQAQQKNAKQSLGLKIVFIDVTQGEEEEQKESYVNEDEAQSIADYIKNYSQEIDLQSLAIMSPFRTQALLIRNVIQEREDLSQEVKAFNEIGAMDEFISRSFKTVIMSFCKTKNAVKNGGPLLNNPNNIDYIKSRSKETLIVFGKAKALNGLWKNEFYENAKTQMSLTEI